MKKSLLRLIIFILAALIVASIIIYERGEPKESKEYNIGVILPLTGSAAYLGENIQLGMKLAQDKINSKGGIKGKLLKLSFEDSMNDPKTGVAAYKKLISEKDVNIICVAMSTVTKSIIPLADKHKIPLFSTAVSAEGIAKESPWIFRFFTRADVDAKVMAEFAHEQLKLKRVAIIHIQDDFGISYKDVFKRIFEMKGGTVPIIESYSFSDTDFRTQLTKIKAVEPDGVYVLSYANNMALIPRQIKELGISATILSVGTISQEFVVKQAPEAIEGAYYTTNAFNTYFPQTDEMKLFVSEYEIRYGKKPEYFEVFGFDTINLIREAIKKDGYSKEGIRKGLLNIKDYKGVAGEISISEEGEVNFPIIIAKVANGRPSPPILTLNPRF